MNFFEKSYLTWNGEDDKYLNHLEFAEVLRRDWAVWRTDKPDLQDTLDTALRIMGNVAMSRFADEVAEFMQACESPVEQVMCAAMVIAFSGMDVRYFRGDATYKPQFGRYDACHISTQASVGKYRVDFLVEMQMNLPDYKHPEEIDGKEYPGNMVVVERLVIECDGHDFHEKTKEQAKRDKSRDRELKKFGYTVFHYTGSEVWTDVFKCAAECLKHLEDTLYAKIERPKKS